MVKEKSLSGWKGLISLIYLFILAIDARVGIFMGHISTHESDFEHPDAKFVLYAFFIDSSIEPLRDAMR